MSCFLCRRFNVLRPTSQLQLAAVAGDNGVAPYLFVMKGNWMIAIKTNKEVMTTSYRPKRTTKRSRVSSAPEAMPRLYVPWSAGGLPTSADLARRSAGILMTQRCGV